MADVTQELPLPTERPPPRTHGPVAWLRANLFNSPLNTILTLLALYLLAATIPAILRWALIDAVWSAPNGEACRAAAGEGGACWAFVGEKLRFILFGRYPYREQWRPLLVVAIFIALIAASCLPPLWSARRRIRPVIGVAVGLVLLPLAWMWLVPGTTDLVLLISIVMERPYWLRQSLAEFLQVAVIAAIVLAPAFLPNQSLRRLLVLLWAAGLAAAGILMRGGVFGLSYVETSLWGGLPLTLILAIVGMIFAFPFGILLALGRRSELPAVRTICIGYIELVRGVPLITVLFMASVMLPLFLPTGMTIDKLLRAQVAFVLFAAAYLAEVVRGGLQAIPKGQIEAADALGFGYWRRTRLIVLPQALALVIPPLVNTFIGMFKDTSLVIVIGLFDLLGTVNAALTDAAWQGFSSEAYVFVAAIYFSFCFFMSRYSQMLEREFNRSRAR